MFKIIGAAVAFITALSGAVADGQPIITDNTVTTVYEVSSSLDEGYYDDEAKDFAEEIQTEMNEKFNTEERRTGEGIFVDDYSVTFKRNEDYDNTYDFRVDAHVSNGHTVSEIVVIDMEDNTELAYFCLVDNELLTPENCEYYRDLLALN